MGPIKHFEFTSLFVEVFIIGFNEMIRSFHEVG